MQTRTDPRTGNKLSALGFGCMRLPGALGRIDKAKTEELLLHAIDQGVNYFDTAYLYPGSEAVLGELLEKHAAREKIFLATKLPHMMCQTSADFDRFFSAQRNALRTGWVDYYFIHNLTSLGQWQRLVAMGIEEWIEKQKAAGAIRSIGFSWHGSRDEFIALLDLYDWDHCQIQYNYINTNYQAGMAGLHKAAEKGLPVMIMEPLLGGRLATGLPKKAEEAFKKAAPGRTPVAWALAWLWDQPAVTTVLSGMNSMPQVEENIALAKACRPGSLTESDRATIEKVVRIFNESYKVKCTGCNYCMPCPKGINIPASFAAYNASYSINWATGMQQYLTSSGGLAHQPHFASACVSCGKCEGHCPQHIEIRRELKTVTKRLEPKILRLALPLYKRFVGS